MFAGEEFELCFQVENPNLEESNENNKLGFTEIDPTVLDESYFPLFFLQVLFSRIQNNDNHFYKCHGILGKSKNRMSSSLRNSIYIVLTMVLRP